MPSIQHARLHSFKAWRCPCSYLPKKDSPENSPPSKSLLKEGAYELCKVISAALAAPKTFTLHSVAVQVRPGSCSQPQHHSSTPLWLQSAIGLINTQACLASLEALTAPWTGPCMLWQRHLSSSSRYVAQLRGLSQILLRCMLHPLQLLLPGVAIVKRLRQAWQQNPSSASSSRCSAQPLQVPRSSGLRSRGAQRAALHPLRDCRSTLKVRALLTFLPPLLTPRDLPQRNMPLSLRGT